VELQPLPKTFAATREALHRVAEQIVAPARKPHNEIALAVTPGGFGTPPFDFEGKRMQVRCEGAELVRQVDGEERRAVLVTLADAAELIGPALFPDGAPDDREPLGIDAVAADRLADFYACGNEALERFRDGLPPDAAASEINLWPEHFDVAIEAGAEGAGQRANYGASPGDDDHPEPYVYVGPWTARPEGAFWNATAFPGAELGYADLLAAPDPVAATLEFFDARAQALTV
jgi:hypothetical protein